MSTRVLSKRAGLGHTLRQVVQALRHRGTGGHRGAEAARHEFFDGGQAGQTLFAQLGNAAHHQLFIGAAGPEAELAGRQATFHLSGQACEFVQQRLVVTLAAVRCRR